MSSPHYSKDSQIATANANSDGSQYRQIQQRPSSLSLPSLGYHSAGTAANGDTFDGNHRGGYATAPSTPSVASTRCFHYSLGSGEDQQSAPPGRPSSGGPTSSTASTTSTALPKEKEKARRTKSGCLTCRRRRVKCDEAHPICNRCTIAKQDCVYPDPSLALSKAAQRAAARNGSVAPTVMSAGSSAPSSGNGSAKRVRKGGTGVITDRPSTSAKLSDPKEHEHDPSTRPGSRSHSPITTTSVPIQGPSEHRGSLSLPSMSAFFQPVEYPTPFGSAPLAPFAHPLRPSNYASLQTGSHSSTSVPPSHPADGGAVPLHFDSLFHTENATAYRTNSANERDSIEELRKRFQGGEGDDDDAGTGFGPAESGPSSAINNLDAIWTDPEYLSRMLESLRGTSIGRDDAFLNMLGDQQDRVDSHSQLQIAEGGDYFDAAGAPSGAGLVLSNPTAAPLSVPAGAETGPDDKTGVATGTTTADPAQRRYLAAYDFSPQPAIDPILAASSSLELHRQAANRDKAVPSLQELGLGPPPVLAGATFTGQLKDWTVPANMEEAMKGMPVQRHAELLRHYFVNIVGLFNPIDHAKNPFRTFVAEHVADSLCLLHAVLALSAINQQPHSVEARAESMLYFEASVDLYVRSLQQQDDIGLFTLLLLSLYSVFDAGTTQPQHFSQRAQGIINARFDLLSAPAASQRTGASADFRFLVRLHVVYEVLANLSRRPGDLRSVSSGKYTLSTLLQIIEQWDQEEERRAGLSGFNYEDYTMTGLLGIPTFFVSLLNEITQLKEEQHALRLQEVAASLPVEGDGQVQMSAGGAKDEEGEHTTANPPAPPSPTEVRAAQSKLTQKIRDLESKIQFARPGRLLLPPSVAREAQVHRAVSVRFFDLFRLGTSIHLLLELHEVAPNDQAIQARVGEIVNLLGNIEQNSNYNTSAIFAFFIAGAVATSQNDRSVLYRRLDSTWNSPAGNIWSLRSIMDEVWQRNSERLEAGEPCHSWKDVAQARRWTLLIM